MIISFKTLYTIKFRLSLDGRIRIFEFVPGFISFALLADSASRLLLVVSSFFQALSSLHITKKINYKCLKIDSRSGFKVYH